MKQKQLLMAIFAVCAMNLSFAVANNSFGAPPVRTQANLPKAVVDFLNTPVGQRFTADEVMKVYNAQRAQTKSLKGVVATTMLTEGFSLWKAGTEDNPDPIDISTSSNFDSYMSQPGWLATYAYQAGGKAYLGFDDEGDGGPGYLKTPSINLQGNEGLYRVKFRVKNANKDVTDQNLQYFVMDDDPENPEILLASPLAMSTDWSEVEFIADGGRKYTSVMFMGWQGHVLVDTVTVESLSYPLRIPQNVQMEMVSANQTKVTWDAVEGATSYDITITEGGFNGDTLGTATVTDTKAVVTATITPESQMYAYVVAKSEDGESYPGFGSYTPAVASLETPTAKEATNVSSDGFTANWEAVPNALNYKLNLTRTHEVTEDTENLVLLSDDFNQFTVELDDPKSMLANVKDMSLYSLDDVLANPGWSLFVGIGAQGYLGITNIYDAQGIPGALLGPVADFSMGGGKAVVSGSALTMMDDAILKIGFGKLDVSPMGKTILSFNEGAKEVEISTKGTSFNVEVGGGSKDSQLIFQITDAAQGGDMVLFDDLDVRQTLKKGDKYTLPYAGPTLSFDATSYDVQVPFTGNDFFQYNVTAAFGSVRSSASNTVTVNSPTSGINEVEKTNLSSIRIVDGKLHIDNPEKATVELYSVNGVLIERMNGESQTVVEIKDGTYIVKVGDKIFKIIK